MGRKQASKTERTTAGQPETAGPVYESPSETLRRIIRERGLTAYAVAKMAAVARPDPVQRFLKGERTLRLDTFDKIAAGLGLRLIEETPTRSGTDQNPETT